MAEIRQARISGYLNPDLPEEDLQAKAIRKKQAAMQEAIGKFQIANLKEQQRVMGVNRKAEDWFNKNADKLYSQGSNPLDVESQYFSDASKMADLYKSYQAEVGGNYQTFQTYIEAGKANEAKNNSRQLTMMIDDYGEDAPDEINKLLRAMPDGDRNRLFSMLDDDTYSRLNSMYDIDSNYTAGDWWDEYGTTAKVVGGTGIVLSAVYALKKGKTGPLKNIIGGTPDAATIKGIANAGSWKEHTDVITKQWKKLHPNATKKEFEAWQKDVLWGGETEKIAKRNFNKYRPGGATPSKQPAKGMKDIPEAEVKRPVYSQKGKKFKGVPKGKQVAIYGQKYDPVTGRVVDPNMTDPSMVGGSVNKGRTAQQVKDEFLQKRRSKQKLLEQNKSNVKFTGGKQQDFDFEKARKDVIPDSKLKLQKAQASTFLKQGAINKKQYDAIVQSIDEISEGGGRVTKGALMDAVSKKVGGQSLLDKIANKEIKGFKLFGAAMAGAMVSGTTFGAIGNVIGGETGQEVGEIAGTAIGAEMAPRMLNQLQELVKKKGAKHIMDKIIARKGSAYLAGLMAKGALGSLFTASTYGIGSVATGLFLAKDIYDIYNILKEDLD